MTQFDTVRLRMLDSRAKLLEAQIRQIQGAAATADKEGNGDPEGAQTGDAVGQLWRRRDGGANTGVYVFEGTPGNNTGWRAL